MAASVVFPVISVLGGSFAEVDVLNRVLQRHRRSAREPVSSAPAFPVRPDRGYLLFRSEDCARVPPIRRPVLDSANE
jgi:hypothetical protein